MDELEARVRRLEAIEEIRQLVARFSLAVDQRDVASLVALFVDDVVTPGGGVGRDALAAWVDPVLRSFGMSFHLVGAHVIDLVDDDHATGVAFARPEAAVGDRWVVAPLQFWDRYERRDGRWWFASREAHAFSVTDTGVDPHSVPGRFSLSSDEVLATSAFSHAGRAGADLPERWGTWRRYWDDTIGAQAAAAVVGEAGGPAPVRAIPAPEDRPAGPPASGALAARVDRLEATAAIRDLPARYALHYAELDMDSLADLYRVDAGLHDGSDGGRRALHERFVAGTEAADGVRMAVLHVGNHVIELTDDGHATGSVYCHAEVQRGDGSSFHQAIHYADHYVRVGAGWAFDRQRVHELFYGTAPGTRPNDLPPADWPAHDTGRGSVPQRWASWEAFWAGDQVEAAGDPAADRGDAASGD